MAAGVRKRRSKTRHAGLSRTTNSLHLILPLLPFLLGVESIHHMQRRAPARLAPRYVDSTPLQVTNMCPEDIYPGINTQAGSGPSLNGFKLNPGQSQELTVSENWQGRVWGRTNCSFNADGTKPANGSPGKACGSGDCNGMLNCTVTGDVPVTLAEFTLDAGDGQTYYDISLVDGYNIPMAIELAPHGNSSLDDLPPNLTNPACTGTVGLLAPQNWMPYANGQTFLGTNSSFPLPLDIKVDDQQVTNWCQWELQVNPPMPPSDGMYTYPDHSVQRPAFNPCYSACAKWNLPQDCCTGQYNSPSTCPPSQYARSAKMICPDAYSYAFDDQTSTFVIPSGAGFNIIFCPRGRSTNILTAEAQDVSSASDGQVSFGGGGSSDTTTNMAAAVRSDITMKHHEDERERKNDEQRENDRTPGVNVWMKRSEYDWAGLEHLIYQPIAGTRVVDMVKRGRHLEDWEGNRMRGLEAQKRPRTLGSYLRMTSTATAVAPSGEMKSTTWYLMGGGLCVTAAVFMML